MRIYIVSDIKSALFVDGEYSGCTLGDLQYFKHDGKNICVCFLPQNCNLDKAEAFFSKIDQGVYGKIVSVRFKNDYLLFPIFGLKPSNTSKILYRKTFDDNRLQVTLCSDPFYKINVELNNERYFTLVKYFSHESKIECLKSDQLLFVHVRDSRDYLYVFTLNPLSLVYASQVKRFSISKDCVCVEKHQKGATCLGVYEKRSLADFSFISKSYERAKKIECVPALLRPYAFLDELSEGADFSDFLCDDVKRNANLVPSFFDDFLFYIPLIKNSTPFSVLVYENKVETVSFSLKNGFINDFAFE